MIRRSTWIILLIFLAVLGGGLYFQKYQSERAAQVTPTSENKLLFLGLEKTQIKGFEIDSSQGKKFSVARTENGEWVVAGYTAADTNTYSIEDMLKKITSLTVMSDLESAPDLSLIGLLTPSYIFKVTQTDGQQLTAYIGGLTPTNSGYYARLEGGSPVVVSKYAVDNLVAFLEKPPVATPVTTVTPTVTEEVTQTPQP